jgi:hypothetical protein
VQVAGAARRATTRIVAGVGELEQSTRDGYTGRILGGRTIERSGDVVCGLHRARGVQVSWLGLKNTGTIFSSLASKPVATVFSDLASKPVATASSNLASKSVSLGFLVCASKPAATVW